MSELYQVFEYDPYMPEGVQYTVVAYTTKRDLALAMCSNDKDLGFESLEVEGEHLEPFLRYLHKEHPKGVVAGCFSSEYEDWVVTTEEHG